MVPYIQIRSVGEGVWYKARVIGGDWHDVTVQNARFARTLGNTTTMSFGSSYLVYAGTAKIKRTEDTGYADTAKWREWASSTDYTRRQLQLIDHEAGSPVAVFLRTDIDPTYLNSMKEFSYVPFEFLQRA